MVCVWDVESSKVLYKVIFSVVVLYDGTLMYFGDSCLAIKEL
jgi:hypothetical protein